MSTLIAILILIAVLLVTVTLHELGHFLTARAAGAKVVEFAIGFPPRLFGIKRGETQYSLNLIPLGAFVKTTSENDPNVPGSLASLGSWRRMGVYFAGPMANALLAFIVFVAFFMIPTQVVVGSELGVEIMTLTQGYPAEEAGVQVGDIIKEINGVAIHTSDDLRQAIEGNTGEITLLLQRDDTEISKSLTPVDNEGEMVIGIGYRWPSPYITETQRYSFWEATYNSGKVIVDTPTLLKDAILHNPGQAVSGPVGVGQIAVEVLRYGLSNVLLLLALINLGIGLFNLFPIPPLDGGGMLVALIEGIRRGKRLSLRATQLAYTIGAVILITLIVVITYNDILRLIKGESFVP